MENDAQTPITIYDSQTPFHKLVVPASMRSQYWRYFGFPADESNNIITRNKIVCCLCRRQIAYNKNTTNMSTHLLARHNEIMQEHFPNDLKSSSKKTKRSKPPKTPQSTNKRVKTEQIESDQWSDDYDFAKNQIEIQKKVTEKSNKIESKSGSLQVLVTTEDGEEFVETLEYGDCHGLLGLDSESLSDNEPNELGQHEFLNEEYLLANVNVDILSQATSQNGEPDTNILNDAHANKSNKRLPKKSIEVLHQTSNKLDEPQVAEAIKHFVVTDVLSPSIVDGIGFQSLLKRISGQTDIPIPGSSKIADVIEEDFTQKSANILQEIESLSKDVWYSLAFDKWISDDGKENIIISFNHLVTQETEKFNALKRQIVFILNENYLKYLSHQFKDFKKCSATIFNWELEEKDPLRLFLQKKKIPIIQSFSSVIEATVRKCFELSEMESTFHALANLKENTERKIQSSCWLNQFSHLNELIETNEIQTNDHLLTTVKAITECLRPLKNCLDILSQESTTWASMMKPLAHSLITEHYSVPEKGLDSEAGNDIDDLINSMKSIIAKNLTDKITSNWFLTIASFLDPRFHGITSPEDLERIQVNFSKNIKDGNKLSAKAESSTIATIKNETQKRNSLSSLFANLPVGQNSKTTKNRIETEIRSYTEDVNVDIDQCPLSWWWWSTSDMVYPNLKSYVQQYFSVPPFVNELHRLSLIEQLQYREKCKKIHNDIDRKIMWLHINSSDDRDRDETK